MKFIPYARQSISKEDIEEVSKVLRDDFLTQGPLIPKFEELISSRVNARYSTAVNSATSALQIACQVLKLEENDWLWTSPNTFAASANCALHCKAKVDFIDIDKKTYNISVAKLRTKLIEAKVENKLPKILIAVHYAGQSCKMKEIKELSLEFNFRIIEDASHALGGKYLNDPVGCCKYSDITIFSFHPVKIITTGEGGVAVTNNSDLDKEMKLLRSHGISRDKNDLPQHSDKEIWNYAQIKLGYNFRLPDINCALGINQISRLDEFLTKRHQIARTYDLAFKNLQIREPWQDANCYSSFHLYPIRIIENPSKINRNFIFKELKKRNIGVNIHYIPVYRHPIYEKIGFKSGYCEEAESFFREVITLPIFPGLTEEQQSYVIESIFKIFQK